MMFFSPSSAFFWGPFPKYKRSSPRKVFTSFPVLGFLPDMEVGQFLLFSVLAKNDGLREDYFKSVGSPDPFFLSFFSPSLLLSIFQRLR